MLVFFVFFPILLGVFLYFFNMKKATRLVALASQVVILAASGYLFAQARILTETTPLGRFEGLTGLTTSVGGYEGVMGVVLMADTLSTVFIMLTAFMFLIAIIYSYNENNNPLFWFLLFLWQGTLMGVFLTSDFFNIFVLMEVSTVAVTILILFNKQKRSLYDGLIYLMINVIVMQFYMFGIGYVYKYTGTLSIYEANTQFAGIYRGYLILPYALIMTFVVLKCALVPLFSWLPKAHGTSGVPSSVSAVLSGLHIKSSIYLFLRFQYTFEVVALSDFFLVLGIVTAIVGFIMALAQTDMKLVLAYHTISQVGLIFTGFNLGGPYSYIGSLYHMLNHALFKSTLFLSAGIIAHVYKTRNLYDIRGVFKNMPLVGIATLLAIFGITGTPIFNGSVSKYFIATGVDGAMSWILVFMSLGTIVSFIKYSGILFGKRDESIACKVDVWQQVPILVLGAMCFVGGIFGQQVITFLFQTEARIDGMGYLEKMGIFFASLVVGFLVFKYYVKNSKLLKKVRTVDLSFRTICIAIGAFFACMLIFTGFVNG